MLTEHSLNPPSKNSFLYTAAAFLEFHEVTFKRTKCTFKTRLLKISLFPFQPRSPSQPGSTQKRPHVAQTPYSQQANSTTISSNST